MNSLGNFPSASPVKASTAQPGWALAADAVLNIDREWGGGRATAFKDMPPHTTNDGTPDGGNHLYMDGSARWIPFEQMLFIHSWNTSGSRDAYFYQEDLGDLLTRRVQNERFFDRIRAKP